MLWLRMCEKVSEVWITPSRLRRPMLNWSEYGSFVSLLSSHTSPPSPCAVATARSAAGSRYEEAKGMQPAGGAVTPVPLQKVSVDTDW
jgi:hypothetical protein